MQELGSYLCKGSLLGTSLSHCRLLKPSTRPVEEVVGLEAMEGEVGVEAVAKEVAKGMVEKEVV